MNELQLHTAGATVRHRSPFEEISVRTDAQPLPAEIRERWVRPLYFGLHKPGVDAFLSANLSEADDPLVDQLLGQFDWRPRTVGALLAALLNRSSFTNFIGDLLLRSDVCYAGHAYCIALASFQSPEAIAFLKRYLDYYLTRPDLWFDQIHAMSALAWLDSELQTNYLNDHLPAWERFVEGKSAWNLEQSSKGFSETMALVSKLRWKHANGKN